MTSPFPALERPKAIAMLRWMIGVVLVFGLIGCVVKGANNPPDPYLASLGSASGSRTPLANFGEVRITVHTADNVLEWCLLLAETATQRERGLMQVTDPTLGGHAGMLFRYDTDVTEQYWMRNTPMPLSIAYVSQSGKLVSTADMAPCADSPDCREYPAAGPYRLAVEVPQGQLPSLGIVQGNTVVDEKTACT